jgi:GT2 family glycosyltransferase
MTVFGNARHRRMGKRWEGNPISPELVKFATSCALLIRREVFQRTAGFYVELASYSEDLELSIKVRRAGYGILFVPDARVHHRGSRNVIRVAGKIFRDYYTMRNCLHIIRTYGTALQTSVGVVCTVLWYAFAHGIAYFLRGEWKHARASFLVVQDFLSIFLVLFERWKNSTASQSSEVSFTFVSLISTHGTRRLIQRT